MKTCKGCSREINRGSTGGAGDAHCLACLVVRALSTWHYQTEASKAEKHKGRVKRALAKYH